MFKKAATTLSLIGVLVLTGCQNAPKDQQGKTHDNPVKAEFDEAIDRDPTPQTLYAMSRILVARSQHEKARYVLGRIIDNDPNYIPAYNALAESLMHEDRLDEALAALELGLTTAPTDATLNNNLGMVLVMQDNPGDAVAYFDVAVENAPRNARFQANRAAALAMSGAYDDALGDYLAVMSAEDAHHNLGIIAQSRGDTERAEMEFALAAGRTP